MVSAYLQQFLESAIDTPTKLQCVVLFAERAMSPGTCAQIANRLARDIWSTQQALDELTLAGILTTLPSDGVPIYEYRPNPEMHEVLSLLIKTYNDPLSRDALYQSVRELARYAPYRMDFARAVAYS